MSDAGVLRASGTITAFTLASRATGFVRVAVVAAVLGTTFLGNTYQSANTLPNLLFELAVAGTLQAALVPTLVGLIARGSGTEADRVAGGVLGVATALLAVVAAAGMLAAPWIMRALVSGVDDPSVRDAQVRLGTFFLWCFLPQVVFYAAGMVATAALHARNRFAAAAAAPIVNNVVVVVAYAGFWLLRDGAPPSLDLSLAQKAVLAGGTTLGVAAFCAVPVVAARRAGARLRPRLGHRDPAVRAVVKLGAWAAVTVAAAQVPLAAMLVLTNGVPGGVVAFQLGLTALLLPHALVAVPLTTASFPALSRHAPDRRAFASEAAHRLRLLLFLSVPAAAALAVLARPLARVVLFGAGDPALVAAALAGLALGLPGLGLGLYAGRAFAALGDTRTPALISAAATAGGVLAMAAGAAVSSGRTLVAAVALGYSAAATASGLALVVALRRRMGGPVLFGAAGVPTVVAGAVAAGAMWSVEQAMAAGDRLTAAGEGALAGVVGITVYVAVHRMAGGGNPLHGTAPVRTVATRG